MPSVKNPNGPSKNRLAARASRARKERTKKSLAGKHKIDKADTRRGAKPGLLPTSGPNRRISAKKAKKLEKKLGYAVQRSMAADGEAVSKGETPHDARQRWDTDNNANRDCVIVAAEEDEEVREGPDENEMEGIM